MDSVNRLAPQEQYLGGGADLIWPWKFDLWDGRGCFTSFYYRGGWWAVVIHAENTTSSGPLGGQALWACTGYTLLKSSVYRHSDKVKWQSSGCAVVLGQDLDTKGSSCVGAEYSNKHYTPGAALIQPCRIISLWYHNDRQLLHWMLWWWIGFKGQWQILISCSPSSWERSLSWAGGWDGD